MVLLDGCPKGLRKTSSHACGCPAAIGVVALQITALHCCRCWQWWPAPALFTGLLPAGSLYSTFAACYLKMAGDDMELGASFQKQVDKAYMGQQKAATPPGAADVSVIPEPHLNHPDIRDNGLFQVRQ